VSLILDALRKADSERERESVPGLHTQPVPPLSLEVPAPARSAPWRWIVIGGSVVLLVALAWFVASRGTPRPAPAAAPPPEPVAPPVAPPVAVPNAIVTELPKEIAPPAAWPAPERKVAPKPQARADTQPTVAAGAVPSVYTREQLPDNIRAALPPLAVGGSIYSSTRANRSLILDGRLYRENEQLAADLLLEEIGQKTAVLRFRGYRFEIRY